MSSQGSVPTAGSKPQRKPVIPQEATFAGKVAAALTYALVRSVDTTVRYNWIVHPSAEEAIVSGPVIFATWHNRLALSLMVYVRLCRMFRRSGRWVVLAPRMAAMVSASRDGGLLARVLGHFGVQPVRGSSSRRGPQALLELTTWAERGYDLAVTPDGPRGPREVVQEGVVALAQLTGLPIVPAICSARWRYVARSWDRFQVPIPFSRCDAVVGRVFHVERDADSEKREALRAGLQQCLREISEAKQANGVLRQQMPLP